MEKINLTFGSLSDYRFALKVTIFDGNDKNIQEFKAEKIHTVSVEPGIYTVRLELNGILIDHILRVHSDERIAFRIPPEGKDWKEARILTLPMIFSSIPFDDENFDTYKSSHEYYSQACMEWSQKATVKEKKNDQDSSIFVFFRFPNKEQYDNLKDRWSPEFSNSFSLCNENYKVIKDFDEKNCIVDSQVGFLAFNMALAPGTYYIRVKQNTEVKQEQETIRRELIQLIPVQVFTYWHSQVFMTLGEQPLYGTLRVILSRERKFDSRNVINKYIDILTDKIQNNEAELSTELIKYVANHKAESPMLALLCIHAYMNGESNLNDAIIGRMIAVLNGLILRNNSKSPDIKAIELLAEKYLGEDGVTKKELNDVPMLRLGVQAISDAAMQWPSLIGSKGMLDYAIEGLQRNSVFTVFEWNESNVLQTFDTEIEILTDSLTDMIIKSKGIIQRKGIGAEQILEASANLMKTMEEKEIVNKGKTTLFWDVFNALKQTIRTRKEQKEKAAAEAIAANTGINLNYVQEIKEDLQSSETAKYIADYVLDNPNTSTEQVSVNLNIPQPTVERVLTKDETTT